MRVLSANPSYFVRSFELPHIVRELSLRRNSQDASQVTMSLQRLELTPSITIVPTSSGLSGLAWSPLVGSPIDPRQATILTDASHRTSNLFLYRRRFTDNPMLLL